LIKELFDIRLNPIQDRAQVWKGLALGFTLLTTLCWWRANWNPLLFAAPVFLVFALFPMRAAWLLSGIRALIAYFFHGLNLLLLAFVYLVVATPMGLMSRLGRRADSSWREEPTEQPSSESFLRPY